MRIATARTITQPIANPAPRPRDLLAEIAAVASAPQSSQTLDRWVDPETVFLELFAGEEHAAWLDAGPDASSGVSYLAVLGDGGYAATGIADSGSVEVRHPASGEVGIHAGSVIDVLDATATPPTIATADRFTLGWVGWLGYDSGARAAGVAHAPSSRPDSAMLFADRVICFDHAERTVEVRAFARGDGEEWIAATLIRLGGLSAAAPPPPGPAVPLAAPARLRHSPDDYLRLIASCQRHIVDGDAYQLCLTNQISVRAEIDPLPLYRRLRRLNPTTRGGFIVAGPLVLASTSPELFLQVSPGGTIVTKPIKGTRPRGSTAGEDARLSQELRDSGKEQAENLMIVDLMRNDISRVAALGTVRVPELFRVDGYRNVFQLVSTVTGELAPGRTAIDALRSTFPAGSMTGAPKLRAMQILDELEAGPRGAYAGAFGYLGVGGAVQLSMTIRTVMLDRELGTATIGTGGGITALSDPREELAEMLLKAAPLLGALGADLADLADLAE